MRNAPVSIARAAYLLSRLRFRRALNRLGSRWLHRRGRPNRKASASPARAVFGALVALTMLYGFSNMAYESISNIEHVLGSPQVEDAARPDAGMSGRASTAGAGHSELSLGRAAPAPGSVMGAGVLLGVTFEATLILAAVLLIGIASRELVRPEWDLEWLVTLPLPLPTLIFGMLIERVVTNSLGFVMLGTFLSILAWKCGYGWAAPLPGIGLTIGLLFFTAMIQLLVDTGLRLALPPRKLRNFQAIVVLVSVLPFFLAWSMTVPGNRFLLDWVPVLPDWGKWLPSGFAVRAIASNNARSLMLWTAILMAEVLVAVAIGFGLLRHRLRNGVVAAGPHEAVARRVRPAQHAPSDLRPSTRTLLSAVPRRELLLLRRDPTLLVQTLLVPAMAIGLQIVLASGNQALASVFTPAAMLPAVAFYLAVLTVMQPAFRTLGAEGDGLWILYCVPHSLESILLQKARLWAIVAVMNPVAIFAIAFATVGGIPLQLITSAFVVVLGVPIFSMIAVALGVFGCDPLAQEVQRRIRPTYVYLYLMLASFYGYAVYANDIWQRIALMILTALVAMALWQKARDQFDYLLDSSASPPSRVSLSDGLIAALAFFVLQALVLAVQTTAGRAVSGQGIWIAFCFAGAVTYGVMRFIYWRTRTGGVPVIAGGDVVRALRWGVIGGVAAAICGIAYLELVLSTGLFPALQINPAVDPALPVWLATLAIGVAPVFEEFIFRGLIFGGLRRSLGLAASTLASAAVFAIIHPPAAVIPVFVMGICAALIYERTGALLAPMLVHALYNAAVLGFQWHMMH